MSMLRACLALIALIALTVLGPGPALAAMPDRPDPLVEAFAVCAGRYLALSNETWTAPGQRVDTRVARAGFADLYDAVAPSADDRSPVAIKLRARRLDARRQMAKLIDTALYSGDPRRRRMAANMATHQLLACEAMLP